METVETPITSNTQNVKDTNNTSMNNTSNPSATVPPTTTTAGTTEPPSPSGTSTLFLVESDVHFKDGKIRDIKFKSVEKILNLKKQYPRIGALVCAGDLTDHGCDGAKLMGVYISGHDQQMQAYLEHYERPLQQAGITVHDNIGNHDVVTYPPLFSHYMPVVNYVKRKHGSLCYMFRCGELVGLSLGLYPNKENLQWLDRTLQTIEVNAPLLLCFHFNLEGLWGDWWKDSEKEQFLKHIESRNVKAIICGHRHMSMLTNWRGIPVIQGAGSPIVLCEYVNEKISVTFY